MLFISSFEGMFEIAIHCEMSQKESKYVQKKKVNLELYIRRREITEEKNVKT